MTMKTKEQKMCNKTLTHWSSPTETLNSQYGNLTYQEWCEREVQRISNADRSVEIRYSRGQIAIVRCGHQCDHFCGGLS